MLLAKRFFKQLCMIILFGWPTPVFGCNNCTLALFDYFVPPFFLWQLFPIAWFIAACIVSNRSDPHTGGLPRTWVGILIAIGTFVVGNAFGFGPVPSLFLLIPPVMLSFKTASRNIREKWSKQQSKKYITVSAVGSIAFLFLIVLTIGIRLTRTPGQYVVQWGSAGQGHSIINELKNDPTANLDEIRFIVSKSDSFASAELAETLANRGDPATDFPILLNALKKRRDKLSPTEDNIEEALRILTGLRLPAKTSINEWQKAFNQKYDSADPKNPADRQRIG